MEEGMDLRKERNLELDALRSFAVLYIVGWFHTVSFKTSFENLLCCCVMGLLCFISGFMLSKRHIFDDSHEIVNYYKRRFFRIYPLYFVVLTIYLLMGIITIDTYWKSVLLTNMIIREPLLTLWFISMMFIFYAVVPIFLHNYSTIKALLLLVLLWGGLMIVHHFTDLIDLSLPLYIVPFVFGMIVARDTILKKVLENNQLLLFCTVTLLCVLWFFPPQTGIVQIIVLDIGLIASIPIFLPFGRYMSNQLPLKLIEFLSYASFLTYLSHRVLYALGGKLYHSPNKLIALFYYGCLVLPAMIVISYYLQLAYDKLMGEVRINADQRKDPAKSIVD